MGNNKFTAGDKVQIRYPKQPVQKQILTIKSFAEFDGKTFWFVNERSYAIPESILIKHDRIN